MCKCTPNKRTPFCGVKGCEWPSYSMNMDINFRSTENLVSELSKNLSMNLDKTILTQLNEFISRGLIQVQLTEPILVRSPDSSNIELRQACTLVLKDQEYIERLEAENKELKDKRVIEIAALMKDTAKECERILGIESHARAVPNDWQEYDLDVDEWSSGRGFWILENNTLKLDIRPIYPTDLNLLENTPVIKFLPKEFRNLEGILPYTRTVQNYVHMTESKQRLIIKFDLTNEKDYSARSFRTSDG